MGGAADIEVTGGQRFLVAEVEVGVVLAARRHDELAGSAEREGDMAVGIGLALVQLLLREAVELDAGAGDGLAGEDVVGEDFGGVVAAFGDQHEVAGEQVHAALFVRLVVAEIGVAVPEILFREGLAAADLYVVDGAGLRLHELVQRKAVGVPLADVGGIGAAQHEGGVDHGPGDFVELVAGLVAVVLQELEDVVAVYLLNAYLRLRVGDGAEEQVVSALGGEDGTLADETDGGDFGIDVRGLSGGCVRGELEGSGALGGGNGRSGGFLAATAMAGGQQQAGDSGQAEQQSDFFHRNLLHLLKQCPKLRKYF